MAGRTPKLLTPCTLAGTTLRNRVAAVPVFTGYARSDGRVSDLLTGHYTGLAATGAAMVVVANAAVSADGLTSRHQIRIDDDRFIPGLAALARAISDQGAVPCLQLNHAGRFSRGGRPVPPSAIVGDDLAFNIAGLKTFMESFPFSARFGLTQQMMKMVAGWGQALTEEDIARIIGDFGRAALRAERAGFGMLELHGASGYLISQFLSAFTNRRPPPFGGDANHRARFALEVLDRVRQAVRSGMPVGFRLMTREWTPGGVDIDQAVALARELKRHGASYVSLSAASHVSAFLPDVLRRTAKPAFLKADGRRLRNQVGLPVILSGRIVKPGSAEKALDQGAADLIGLGRPLRADAGWLRKAKGGGSGDGQLRGCINCHWCFRQVIQDRGLACALWPAGQRDRVELEHRLLERGVHAGLWITAGEADRERLRRLIRNFTPRAADLSTTLLFMKNDDQANLFTPADLDFLDWAREEVVRLGQRGPLDQVVRLVRGGADRVAAEQAVICGAGALLLAGAPDETWRKRLIYRLKGRIVGLAGASPDQHRILVAVDLSPTTLNVLRSVEFLTRGREGLELEFIHVLSGPGRAVLPRWTRFMEVLDWEPRTRLNVIRTSRPVAGAILDRAGQGGFGCLVVGKRGGSGIKRMLMGSVSATVLDGLNDQTLFVID